MTTAEAVQSELPDFQTLLAFFKALANESRLKLVGILAQRECSVEELAALLQLKEPTVSHHLAKLKELSLVQMRPVGNTHFYRLDSDALLNLNKAILTSDSIASLSPAIGSDVWEEKILKSYLESGRLKEIPASRRKRFVILKWLVRQFQPEVHYSERQVNELIQHYHPDSATLRRELIGYQMMQRERGEYWRLPEANWQQLD
ncbi:metalloregulator ArsR/SmtB family transcription factor [Phormidium tenue FACHB-886]|nr:metalloregulator ArsR/SmtB family transcription factor [Phormidium tenue FACHB-886]